MSRDVTARGIRYRFLRGWIGPALLWPIGFLAGDVRGLAAVLLAYGVGYADPFNAIGEWRRGR